MKIIHEYPIKVFSKTFGDNKVYSLGISRKDIKGNYLSGYLEARFRKGVEVNTDKKIYIKDAWLDFYLDKERKTRLFIFINQFEYVEDVVKNTKVNNDPWEGMGKSFTSDDVELSPDDYPF